MAFLLLFLKLENPTKVGALKNSDIHFVFSAWSDEAYAVWPRVSTNIKCNCFLHAFLELPPAPYQMIVSQMPKQGFSEIKAKNQISVFLFIKLSSK